MALHTSLLHRLDALTLVQWKIYSYQMPFIAGGVREGLLIYTKNGSGEERWAEAAPFPRRSAETVDLALQQLIGLFRGEQVGVILPSVQFALESLLGTPFEPTTARLYSFLNGTPDVVLKQGEMAKEQGYDTVKLKVSDFSVEDAQRVIGLLQKDFRLRVDCNNQFTLEQANAIFAPFDPAIFDCVEDPTFETERLAEFTHPLAIDEHVAECLKWPLQTYSNLWGFILKPSILGGKKGCAPLIDYAKKHKLKIVFSPAFESGIGLLQILTLAKQCNALGELIGLDTARYLKYDLILPAINFSTPKLTVLSFPQVNQQLLTEVAHGTGPLPHL